MKTLFTTFALVLFVAVAAVAQPLKIGLRGGVNTGSYNFDRFSIDGTKISAGSIKTGYQLGIVARISIPKFIQIQPELIYSNREYGYKLTSPEGSTSRVNISNKRLEIPVLIGFNIAALRLFAGPVFTLKSSSNVNKASKFSVKYNDADVALQVGAGLDIKKFFLDVRYTSGLKSTFHTFTLDKVSYKKKVKTDELWSFNVGFFF